MMRWTILLLSILLSACAGVRPSGPLTSPVQLFADVRFAPPRQKIGTDDLFALSPAMRAYLNSPGFKAQLRSMGKEQGLVDALYREGHLKLGYEADFTRNAAQTFDARAGNCLSLVIMTAALARELGLTVQFQSVVAAGTSSRSGQLQVSSNHVNLSLGRRSTERKHGVGSIRMYTVDFLAPDDMARQRIRPIREDEIKAMYMNNRAAEALMANRLDDAYWWARRGLEQHPSFLLTYNTLGVIYQRHGNPAQAELAFRAALERAPGNLIAMQNLVPVLAAQGKTQAADAMQRQAAALQPFPPFYYFRLGTAAMDAGDYQRARRMFEREVARAPYNDEFHFWLGLAHLKLGDAAQARIHIARALRESTTAAARKRYSAQLARLRA